jgi:hypothetical protein
LVSSSKEPSEAAGAVRQLEVGEQPWHAGVMHGEAVAAGLLPQRAGQPRLADPARAGDEQIAMFGDPAAGGELLEQRLVELARRAVVDILDRRLAVPQPGGAQAALEAPCRAMGCLTVEQHRQPLGLAEVLGTVLGLA